MGLMAAYDPTPPADADQQDRDAARVLHDCVVRKGLLMRRVTNLDRWAKTIAAMRRNGVTAERIKAAVDFYAARAGDKYVPVICSAESLRDKFPQLERAAQIYAEKAAKDRPTCVETPLGQKVYDWAARFRWPAGSDAKLRPAVELSLLAHALFLRAVKDYVKGSTDDRLRRFAETLLSHVSDPATFFDRWWRDVYKSVKDWKGWSGDLMQFAWACDHRRMTAIGREIARRYCGVARRYDELVEALR